MKKLMMSVLIVLICATSNVALAEDRAELSKELMQVLGFESMLEGARQDSIKLADRQIDGLLTQLKNSNPNIPESVMKEFRAAAVEFERKVTDSWSPAEAARLYLTSLVDGLPESEMHAAITRYKTPQGQRELKVINEAVKKTNGYIMGAIQRETEVGMRDFLIKLRAIAQRAKEGQTAEIMR